MSTNAVDRDEEKITEARRISTYRAERSIHDEDHISILVSDVPSSAHVDVRYSFRLEFTKDTHSGVKSMICCELDQKCGLHKYSLCYRPREEEEKAIRRELWAVELDGSTDLIELSEKRFAQILKVYETRHDAVGKGLEVDFTSTEEVFKNLEAVEDYYKGEFARGHFCSAGYPFGYYHYTPTTKCSYQEFRELSTAKTHINTMGMNEEDIFDFVKLWREGNVWARFDWAIWTTHSTFDVKKLWSLLGYCDDSEIIEIKQNQEGGKIGRLYTKGDQLRFFTEEVENVDVAEESPPVTAEKPTFSFARFFHNLLNFFKNVFKSPISEKNEKLGKNYP